MPLEPCKAETAPKSHRAAFQYSLRAFFGWMTVLAVFLAVVESLDIDLFGAVLLAIVGIACRYDRYLTITTRVLFVLAILFAISVLCIPAVR